MFSVLRQPKGPRATSGLWSWTWPSLCLVCHRWQGRSVCADCLGTFAAPLRRCGRCALPLPAQHPLHEPCALCADYPPEFDQAVAALDYTAPWAPLLGQLKFHQSPALAKPLGRLLAQAAAPSCRRLPGLVVVAAPLSAQRLRERGYNQAALLAQHAARALKLPCMPDALLKHTHTQRLMSLSADERMVQIRGAFSVTPKRAPLLEGRHVAVVDDVMTTGATLNELTRTLHEAGVRSVSAWVLARTPPPHQDARDQPLPGASSSSLKPEGGNSMSTLLRSLA